MSIEFKRLNGCPEHFYELDLDTPSHGEFEQYVDNDPNKGMQTGKMIRLHKFWKCGSYRSEVGDVYVSPIMFASEYYPVLRIGDEKGKVETMIQEAYDARIRNMYGEDHNPNPILETWSDATTEEKNEEPSES